VTTVDFGSSAAKAVAVLEAFRGASAVLGVTEISARTGLSKSTVHRLLAVLVEGRLMQRNGNRYMLGRALFELGSLVPDCRPRSLREAAIPAMSELYATTRATVSLAVLEDGEVLFMEKLFGPTSMPTPIRPGIRMPALCTGVGKAMVAFSTPEVIAQHLSRPLTPLTPRSVVDTALLRSHLRVVRETGIAHDREESQLGARSVAVPIARLGVPVGALSVTVRATESVKPQVMEGLHRAADQIAGGLRTAWAS
jgi:DNA-binding IclR family transcriptional regulator